MAKDEDSTKEFASLPTTTVARGTVVGATAIKVGAKKIGLLAKKPFLSKEAFEEESHANEVQIGKAVFHGLSHLRGTALKIAQMLSLETNLLPESIRKELYKSHYQAPPLNRALVRKIIKSDLGKYPEELFQSFDGEAFAAASLGQVHHAIGHDGRRLAVKVQYPGIGDSIASDLQLVRGVMKPFVKSKVLENGLREYETRLSEEVDYRLEFESTEWFHRHLKLEGVDVPEPIAELSGASVLTTTLQSGLHIIQWLEGKPSQEARNRVAQALYDSFMHSVRDLGRFHADPNPGNYLFQEDGQVAIVDFGCIKKVDQKFRTLFFEMINAHMNDDFEACKAVYRKMGVGDVESPVFKELYDNKLRPMAELNFIPHREGVFDFGKNKDYCDRMSKSMWVGMDRKEFEDMSAEPVLFNRTLFGLLRIFQQLEAKVHFDERWLKAV